MKTTKHPAGFDADALLGQCDIRTLRRSGPGGQRRNKVETAVVLRHRPTGIEAEAGERRSQAENRRVALFRLRVKLALEVRGAGETATEMSPSDLWQSRLKGGKIVVNPAHEDFPALLAEALDVVVRHDLDVKQAASVLGCSLSQLIKFFKVEPRAIALVNRWRDARGLHVLK